MASSQRPAVAHAEISEEKCTVLGRTAGWNLRIAAKTCAHMRACMHQTLHPSFVFPSPTHLIPQQSVAVLPRQYLCQASGAACGPSLGLPLHLRQVQGHCMY